MVANGEHGIGKYGIGEHGIGEHGIGEHGIGEHGNRRTRNRQTRNRRTRNRRNAKTPQNGIDKSWYKQGVLSELKYYGFVLKFHVVQIS